MNFVDIIIKKRDGKKLTSEEISFFVKGVTEGSLPDYQISALLMAILLKGMDAEETAHLTMEMANSGAASADGRTARSSRRQATFARRRWTASGGS